MPWLSSELCALDTLEYLLIQSIKKVWKILFSRGEKPLNPAQFATCPPSVFRHSRQVNSALSGPKFRAGGPKFCTGPIICTSSKLCLVLDLVMDLNCIHADPWKREKRTGHWISQICDQLQSNSLKSLDLLDHPVHLFTNPLQFNESMIVDTLKNQAESDTSVQFSSSSDNSWFNYV